MNEFDENYNEEDELLNSDTEQCFLFLCGKTLYAIPALSVNEIIEYQSITKVPLLNSYILGVTNIRGSIVGVVDLLCRFEGEQAQVTNKTSLVVVNTIDDGVVYNIALMVDEIFEVDGLDKGSITEVPTFGTKIKPAYIKSMARYNGHEVYLLDISKVLDISELSQLNNSLDSENDEKLYRRVITKQNIINLNQDDEDDEEDEIDIMQLVSTNANDANQYIVYEGPYNQYYAKNVSKVEEIIAMKDIEIQKNFDENIILGTANIRGEMLTLVNFDKWLGLKDTNDLEYEEIIVLKLGKHKFGLLVRSTEHIITIETKDMTKSSDADSKSTFISQIDLDGKKVLCTIVDSDKMLVDVFQSEKDRSENGFDNISKIDFDKKILFADDSSLVRNTSQKVANKLGVKYNIFENGKLLYEFLTQSELSEIGLVVTDLEMPIMDGKELISKMRADNKYKDLQIIVYTNMANEVLVTELINLGATRVIGKLDIQTLSETIKELLA